jgi:hypothetical protein
MKKYERDMPKNPARPLQRFDANYGTGADL